jgi:hypothetical protein
VRPWIKYTLYRILVFAVLLTLLLLIGVPTYVAAFIAAIVGLIISWLFFRRTRDQVAGELAARRVGTPKVRTDDSEEDILDA